MILKDCFDTCFYNTKLSLVQNHQYAVCTPPGANISFQITKHEESFLFRNDDWAFPYSMFPKNILLLRYILLQQSLVLLPLYPLSNVTNSSRGHKIFYGGYICILYPRRNKFCQEIHNQLLQIITYIFDIICEQIAHK